MNKKANTVFFMIGATVVNIMMMIVTFLILFFIYVRLVAPLLSPEVNQVLVIVLLIGSLVITYFTYNRLVKWVTAKWNLEQYLDPIFGRRGRKKPE